MTIMQKCRFCYEITANWCKDSEDVFQRPDCVKKLAHIAENSYTLPAEITVDKVGPLIGCFCLHEISMDVDDTWKTMTYHIIKELKITEDNFCFYTLLPHSKFDKLGQTKDSDYPVKQSHESMLDYFDRLNEELGGIWIYCDIVAPTRLYLRGKFDYLGKDIISDPEMTRYVHDVPEGQVIKLTPREHNGN
jgi:hypothetical protein